MTTSSFRPADAKALFDERLPWWVAGGWAIDLAVGQQTRPHDDLDIAVLRRDQPALVSVLDGWDVRSATEPGVLERWDLSKTVPSELHALWCRPGEDEDWAFEILLNDAEGDDWLFRRNKAVRLPLGQTGRVSADGVPFLAPEVVLLFKAKNVRDRDELDLQQALPVLSAKERTWLRDAIALVHPGHPWNARLGPAQN
jgi:aminoglycoside-2''-adenylyltransferase